jgi:regulator of sigma E protease
MQLFGNILDWVIALFIFGLLLFVHELGHFVVCRLTRVKVDEFGFGFPPRLVRMFTWQGTEFTLNAIPFGAFVRPTGEDDPTVPGGLAGARKRIRTAVLLGGVFMNALAAILAYTIAFKIAFPDGILVESVVPDTPAAQAGLMAGDLILAADQTAVRTSQQLTEYVYTHRGMKVVLSVSRDGRTLTIPIVPRTEAETPVNQGPTGITLVQLYSNRHNWIDALGEGVQTIRAQLNLFLQLPGMILRGGFNASTDRPVGPVGILDVTEQIVGAARETNRWVIILNWVGMINLALAIGNLLPIPGLDGGRLVFVLLEAVRGKRVAPERERMVTGVSLAILLMLMLFITYLDIFYPVLPR